MIFGKTKQQRYQMLTTKQLWFAWHPVRLRDGRTAWLERVHRYRLQYYGPNVDTGVHMISQHWSYEENTP